MEVGSQDASDLCSTCLCLRVLVLPVNFAFVTGVSVYGRLEDRITIQQNELSEDKAPNSVDHVSEVHVGEHHSIGLITFSKVVSTNMFHLDCMLIESIGFIIHLNHLKNVIDVVHWTLFIFYYIFGV